MYRLDALNAVIKVEQSNDKKTHTWLTQAEDRIAHSWLGMIRYRHMGRENEPKPEPPKPLFPLGQVVGTPGAIEALEQAGQEALELLSRHVCGDCGASWMIEDKA